MNNNNNDFLTKLYRFPLLIVFVIFAITVFFAFQLPRAELDNNNIRFIPENEETRRTNTYIDQIFGSSFFILVALEREYGDVFDAVFLNRIREFNKRVKEFAIVGNVNSIVSSDYIFYREEPGEPGSIVVQKLVNEDFTGTPREISELKQRILSWDIYRRSLISDDFSSTQILVPLVITAEMASHPEIINSIIELRDVAKEMFSGYADVHVTGLPIVSSTINEAMRSDLKTMIPMVVIVVLLTLFFSFRRLTQVILPLITVLIATIWSMGAMPLFGIKLSVISTVLPVILVAVGSAYGIHLVTHYLEDTKGKSGLGREEHRVLIINIVKRIRKAVLLAAITTIAGFISFSFTNVIPVREFGFFASFGVLSAYVTAMTLIPSLLLIRGPRDTKTSIRLSTRPPRPDKIALFFTGIARRRGAVIFTVAVIVALSVWGMSKVVIDNIFVEYFKSTTDIARSDRFIREKFGGSKIVSVVAIADDTETLLSPDTLCAMDGLGSYLENKVPEVGKVMGFTDLIKRLNQVFNADEDPDGIRSRAASGGAASDDGGFGFGDFGFGSFDDDPLSAAPDYANGGTAGSAAAAGAYSPVRGAALNAVEMVSLLREAAFSGRSRSMETADLVREIEKRINYEGAAYYEIPGDPARYGKTSKEELSQLVANYLILLSGNTAAYANDSLSPTAIKNVVQLRTIGEKDTKRAVDRIRAYVDANFPSNIKTIIGGSALVENALNRLVVESQIVSVIICIFMVFGLISLFNRSIMAGVIGVAPLSLCILINFAVMGFSGIKLNIGTSMVAAVTVGIGIDYTIHYMEAYKREFLAAKGMGDFLLKTFTVSGKAILINAASVGAGFGVLLFSQFVMLKHLGLLIALTMASSALVGLTVIPVLLSAIKPAFIKRGLKDE